MKIHNIATFGVIAAIFGSTGQALATTIASQAYVDAKDNLKQDKLKTGSGGNITVSAASGNTSTAITGITANGDGTITFTQGNIQAGSASDYIKNTDTVSGATKTNALEFADDTTHAPSITAVKNMKQAAQTGSTITAWSTSSGDGSSDVKVPSVKAVTQQIDKKIDDRITSTQVTNFGNAYNAVADAVATNAIEAADDLLLKTDAFKDTVAYYNKDDNTFTDNLDAGSIAADDQVFAGNGTIASDMDAYVPTVAAVEARVKATEEAIPNLDTTASATYSNGALTVKTTDIDGNRTNKAATTSQVASTTSAIKSYVDYKATTLDTTASATYSNGTLTVKTTDVDGNRTGKAATTSQVASTTSAIKDYVDYKASGALARKDAVGSSEITDKSVTYNYDMNNTALYDINTGAVPSGDYCTESIPCILTYYKKGGKVYTRWTPMDTESTAVNSATTDAGATI